MLLCRVQPRELSTPPTILPLPYIPVTAGCNATITCAVLSYYVSIVYTVSNTSIDLRLMGLCNMLVAR